MGQPQLDFQGRSFPEYNPIGNSCLVGKTFRNGRNLLEETVTRSLAVMYIEQCLKLTPKLSHFTTF